MFNFNPKDLKSEIEAHLQACNAIFKIPTEQLADLRTTKDKTTVQASDALKEFNQCVINKSGYFDADGQPIFERMISFGVALGYAEPTLRANIDKCKPLYTGSRTLQEDWDLYVCIFSF